MPQPLEESWTKIKPWKEVMINSNNILEQF